MTLSTCYHSQLTSLCLLDLSAAVDVYSDWIDACDAVAKEAAGLPKDNASSSYADQSGMGGRRNMDMQIDKHSMPAVEDDEDGQGDYDDE